MAKRKPETFVLVVSLIGTVSVLLVFLIDLALARQRDLNAGEQRLQHFSVMMAEHTARAFEALDILLREMSTDLSNNRRDWEKWEPTRGWEYVAQRHSRAMPQLRDLIVFDRFGNQRFISTAYPAPHINVKDRPYFVALESGAESATYGPYIGRNSGRYTYAIARRINGESARFNGAVFAAIEPAYLQDFCWSSRLSDNFEAVLINGKGQIVASCRPTDLSRQSTVLGSAAADQLFNGQLRDNIPENGTIHANGLLISVAPVTGFADLRILSAIPEGTILEPWTNRLHELGTLGFFITLAMLVGSLLIRRQFREMAAMTNELAASHEHLEERIREATYELAGERDTAEKANKAKSRFLGAASHDLRQPLHALSLFSADLMHQLRAGNTSALPRLAEQISTSATLLGELLNSLLDVSRLDVNGVKPEFQSFALMPLFDRLHETFRRDATDKQIGLLIRHTDLWVKSDPKMLEQMLTNLISNALRYTPPGGRILVVARWRGEQVQLEVRDSGIGIAPENQSAIFAEFYQVGNAAREQNKGLGLGLSIVDRLARALGHPLNLRSRLGEGTTFSIRLPRALPEKESPPASAAPAQENRLRLLGDSDDLRACRELVAHWGYQIIDRADDATASEEIINIADAALVSEGISVSGPLIVLLHESGTDLPAGAQGLVLPIRPAKLRALLNQLQKTLSKSMP